MNNTQWGIARGAAWIRTVGAWLASFAIAGGFILWIALGAQYCAAPSTTTVTATEITTVLEGVVVDATSRGVVLVVDERELLLPCRSEACLDLAPKERARFACAGDVCSLVDP